MLAKHFQSLPELVRVMKDDSAGVGDCLGMQFIRVATFQQLGQRQDAAAILHRFIPQFHQVHPDGGNFSATRLFHGGFGLCAFLQPVV